VRVHCYRKEAIMKSAIMKRSIVVSGRKTSVSLEDAFWTGLREIAKSHKMTLPDIVADIASRRYSNLSSAIRLLVLEHARSHMSLVENPVKAGLIAPRVMTANEARVA
jgi:predicted DNA-binding ribbon-helix-helix protein